MKSKNKLKQYGDVTTNEGRRRIKTILRKEERMEDLDTHGKMRPWSADDDEIADMKRTIGHV